MIRIFRGKSKGTHLPRQNHAHSRNSKVRHENHVQAEHSDIQYTNTSFHQKGSVKLLSRSISPAAVGTPRSCGPQSDYGSQQRRDNTAKVSDLPRSQQVFQFLFPLVIHLIVRQPTLSGQSEDAYVMTTHANCKGSEHLPFPFAYQFP